MTRRVRQLIILGAVLGLLTLFLVGRLSRQGKSPVLSPILSPITSLPFQEGSPLEQSPARPLMSPIPIPPTAPPPVSLATLDVIRTSRPTATPPSSEVLRLPYISPETWRVWALRILVLAGVFAYIGFRLRRG